MEAIEQELAEKSIERSDAVKEVIVEEKPKPARTAEARERLYIQVKNTYAKYFSTPS